MTKLPPQLQKIIEDGYTASSVLTRMGAQTLAAAHASSMGYGIIHNCDLVNCKGLQIIEDKKTGRAIIRIKEIPQ